MCNSGSTPLLGASDYSLTVCGDAVSVPLILIYDELRSIMAASYSMPYTHIRGCGATKIKSQ